MIPEELDFLEIEKVYKKLSPYIIRTPIIKNSSYLNSFFNTNLFAMDLKPLSEMHNL